MLQDFYIGLILSFPIHIVNCEYQMGYKPDSHKPIFSSSRTKLVLLIELSILSSMAEGLQQMQPIMPQINPNKPSRNNKRIKGIHVLT